ncbi:MAG TPA: CHASE3 domain-containing protein, partial [Gemmatimonadaceae bacterium]
MLRLSLRPNVVAAYLSAAMVCAMGWLAFASANHASTTTTESRSALSVMNAVRDVDDGIHKANIAERDLVNTGDEQYAGAYSAASDATLRALAALRDLAPQHSGVESRMDSLGYFVHLRLGELDETVRLRRESGFKAASEVMRSQRGSESDRRIGSLLGSIGVALERNDLGVAGAARATVNVVLAVVVATCVLAVLLALFVNFMHTRNVRAQRRMTEALEHQSVQLQLQTNELTTTNRDLEEATAEMLRQTVEAERSETRLAGILGSATDAVVSFDDEEHIVYSNAAARRLFGIDEVALAATLIRGVVAVRSVPALEEHMLAARRSTHMGAANPEVWDTLVVHPDDTEIPVEVSMAYTRTGKN